MKQEVWITVRGDAAYGGDGDSAVLTTLGTLEETGGGWRIAYEETELTGLAGVRTELTVAPKRVVLTRSGPLHSEMIFEEGVPHTSLYEVEFGTLTVDIHTESLRVKLGERGGLIEVRYRITLDHSVAGENRLKLLVKTKTPDGD